LYKIIFSNYVFIFIIIKGGISSLTRLMASYYGQFEIRVNTLCPGGLIGPIAGTNDEQFIKFIKNYSEKTPLGRMGEPEEVASTALWFWPRTRHHT